MTTMATHPLSFDTGGSHPALSNLISYLGPPARPMQLDAYQNFNHSSLPMWSTQEGRSQYISQSFEALLHRVTNVELLKEILPLESTSHLKNSYVRKYHHRTLARQTAPGAPPRVVNSSKETIQMHLKRYTLAAIADLGTLHTPEGQQDFEEKLANVIVSIQNTAAVLASRALMSAPDAYREKTLRQRGSRSRLQDVLYGPVYAFGIIHKTDHGFHVAIQIAEQMMSNWSPTHIIVGEALRMHVSLQSPAETEYYRAGGDSRRNLLQGADALKTPGKKVIVAESMYLRDQNESIDALKTRRTIGDFGRMTDHLDQVPDEEYRSSQRATEIFSMDDGNGKFVKIDLMDAIDATQRFMDDGREGALTPHHDTLAQNYSNIIRNTGLKLKNGELDMFLIRDEENGGYIKGQLIGQLDSHGMPDDAIARTSASLHVRVMESLSSDAKQALDDGLALIMRIRNKRPSEGDVQFAKVAIVGSIKNGAVTPNQFGCVNLPLDPPAKSALPYLPFGFGSVGGLQTIAASDFAYLDPEWRSIGVKFSKAIVSVHEVARCIAASSHIAFDPKHVPIHFRTYNDNQNSLTAFAQVLVDFNVSPLWIKAGSQVEATGDTPIEKLRGVLLIALENNANLPETVRAAVRSDVSFQDFIDNINDSDFCVLYAQQVSVNQENALQNMVLQLCGDLRSPAALAHALESISAAVENDNVRSGDRLDAFFSNLQEEIIAVSKKDTGTGNAKYVITPLVASPDAIMSLDTDEIALRSPSDSSKVVTAKELASVHKDSRQHIMAMTYGVANHALGTSTKRKSSAVGHGKIYTNSNLQRRYRNCYLGDKNLLRRICTQLVILSPICRETIHKWYLNNVRIPFEVILMRPRRGYITSAIIFAVGTQSNGVNNLGRTYYAGIQGTQEIDGTAETVQKQLSLYIEACVEEPERLFILRDAMVCDYTGGEGTGFYTPETFHPDRPGDHPASIIAGLCPANSLRGPNAVGDSIDIRGRFDNSVVEGSLSLDALEKYKNMLYPNAAFTSSLNGLWETSPVHNEYGSRYMSSKVDHDNTIMHQMHQNVFNPTTKEWSSSYENTGYFGKNIGPGDGTKRTSGLPEVYEKRNYNYISNTA